MLEFDKVKFINNLYSLAKEKKLKISDLEEQMGVSTGYLSRLAKEENKSNPGISVFVDASNIFNVSIDSLLTSSFSDATPTERYLYMFLEALISDTNKEGIRWLLESYYDLSALENKECDEKPDHPIYKTAEHYRSSQGDYPDLYYTESYNSLFHKDDSCKIAKHCYTAELGKGIDLYLMAVEVIDILGNRTTDYELYLVTEDGTVEGLCHGSQITKTPFSDYLFSLYRLASEDSKHIRISKKAKGYLDQYMNGKDVRFEIDPVDLPF